MATCRNCFHSCVCFDSDDTTKYYGIDVAAGNVEQLCHNYVPKRAAVGRTMVELKPCPFCGGEAEFVTKSTETSCGQVGFGFAIRCKKCFVAHPNAVEAVRFNLGENGEINILEDGRGKAKAAWNRREENGKCKVAD